jgi:uncharacterized membrane protein YesL
MLFLLIAFVFFNGCLDYAGICKRRILVWNFLCNLCFLLALEAIYAVWVMIYISRFEDKTRTILKNCGILFFRHFSVTIIILLILGLGSFFIWFLPVFLFGVPSYGIFLLTYKTEKIFRLYMKEEDIQRRGTKQNRKIKCI